MSAAIRVVSWNIRYGLEIVGAIETLSTAAGLADPDIILLQEMDEPGSAAIADALDLNMVYRRASVHRHHNRDFGNAILSRWPILDGHAIELPHKAAVRGEQRIATRATVRVGALDIVTYSVHTEVPTLRLAARIAQFDRIAEDVSSIPPGPIIVGGDFNTVTGRGVRALGASMGAAELTNVSRASAASFRRLGLPMNMDHIFSRRLSTVRAGTGPASTSSDHRPIWADLR